MNVSNFFISNSYQISANITYKNVYDTTLAAPAASIDTGTITSYSYYKILLMCPGTSGLASSIGINFNNDATNK